MVPGEPRQREIRVPRRRQHRDVHADRQLQGRPGPCAGAAGAAGTIGAAWWVSASHSLRWFRPTCCWAALRALRCDRWRCCCSLSRSRGALVRTLALALMVLALANPSFTREDREPLTSVAVVVVDKSPSQNFGDRADADRAGPRRAGRAARPHPEPRGALRRGRRRPTARPTARGCSRRSARRSPTCRPTASPARSSSPTAACTTCRRTPRALGFAAPVHALITGQPNERDRRVVLVDDAALRHRRPVADHRLSRRGSGRARHGRRQVTVRRDGEVLERRNVHAGQHGHASDSDRRTPGRTSSRSRPRRSKAS